MPDWDFNISVSGHNTGHHSETAPKEDVQISKMKDDFERVRLTELERLWNEKFIQQPKLPTSALLTGSLSMAMACGFVLFVLSAWMRRYAWIWLVLSVAVGLLNRFLAHRWYTKVVLPWDTERRATSQEIKLLQQKLTGP